MADTLFELLGNTVASDLKWKNNGIPNKQALKLGLRNFPRDAVAENSPVPAATLSPQ